MGHVFDPSDEHHHHHYHSILRAPGDLGSLPSTRHRFQRMSPRHSLLDEHDGMMAPTSALQGGQNMIDLALDPTSNEFIHCQESAQWLGGDQNIWICLLSAKQEVFFRIYGSGRWDRIAVS